MCYQKAVMKGKYQSLKWRESKQNISMKILNEKVIRLFFTVASESDRNIE
jgi:hypothetical protein